MSRYFIVSFLILAYSLAHADSIWEPGEYAQLCTELNTPNDTQLNTILGNYKNEVISQDGIPAHMIRAISYDKTKPLLSRSVTHKRSILELFTDKVYTNADGCAFLFDKETLALIDKEFDLHGLWLINAPIADKPNSFLKMKFLLIGQRKLIIGYPGNESVRVPDYEVFMDKYKYKTYISAKIIHNNDRRALDDIRTKEGPDKKREKFEGPIKFTKIRALDLRDKKVVIPMKVLPDVEVALLPITSR